MSEGIYRVVLTGTTLVGTSAEQAVANFSGIFRIPIDRARSVVGRRVVVRRRVDESTAQGYVSALQKAGLDAFFEFDDEADRVTADTTPGPPPLNQMPPPVPPQTTASAPPIPSGAPPIPQSATTDASIVTPPPLPPHAAQAAAAFDVDRSHGPVVGTLDVGEFLASLGLSHLKPLFDAHGLTREMLTDLSDADLQSIGVSSLGERKRILGAVRQAKEDEMAHQAVSIHQESERAGTSLMKGFLIAYGVTSALIALAVWTYMGAQAGLTVGVVSFLLLWIHFLPTQIAFRKQSEYRWAIFVGNVFFGATVFGWVVLLVLAKRLVSGKAAATIGIVGALAGGL